ncbi:MAG TPA: tRNA (guanosine(46)-N7)-methyltransferase TrmB [Thiotrichaceae bacterium]|jgi:tRNA (guanine-N7-)-methyltransferase|nr:tRNA (guanosine(46)-N7)-methyltransferase TrmB [Thiotrichaceae bacterium]HIM08959.1 tRNA (guanosine(46)-N7)-methyltransferase TrmB [Gammaproteobacteria bacterium]
MVNFSEHYFFLNQLPFKQRTIRSFVKRDSRLTKSQLYALENYWALHGIDYDTSELNIEKLFSRKAPLILDIGVGTGDTTLHHAMAHPENNYLAIEVHRPGIGHLLNQIETHKLSNIKIINHDVIDVLNNQIPNNSISQIFIFFPDPWPKKKHHKRRLINTSLITLLINSMTQHGRLHIATDWEDYALHIQDAFTENDGLMNLAGKKQSSPRPNWRIKTRFELRGLRLEHQVWDFCYALNNIPKK